jgi:hypothetical protein
MPRYKVLKGVAHNIGHSFTSLMNYASDDYTMGHILRLARESGKDTLVIDFMTGVGAPFELLQEPISELPRRYSDWFWRLVKSCGSDRSLVQSANLTVKYDLLTTTQVPNGFSMSPYVCDVSIVDTRGKGYSAHFQDWWYVERISVSPPRLWWKPTTWFRTNRSKRVTQRKFRLIALRRRSTKSSPAR